MGVVIREDPEMGPMELRAEAERIDVTSGLPYPDESWTFTDAQGHEHRHADGAQHYPTLTWVIDAAYWCEDCRDEHTHGHYECHLCGEQIEPGLAGPDLFRKYIPGPVTYYLNDEPISEERYRELAAQLRGPG